ncbi:hypothetical protein QEN19_003963 [Hanseniaspora menglaensis]
MSVSQLNYSNTSSSDAFFKELMTRNMGLILKSCGFDGVESRYLLNYMTDLHLKIIESFIKELANIISKNTDLNNGQLPLADLVFLLNKFNVVCDSNYNVDETVLQIKDFTNNKITSIVEEKDTQGIEYFQKWVEENTAYNFDYKNLTKNLKVKNLNVFNNNLLNDEIEDERNGKASQSSNKVADQLLNIPDNINPDKVLDWVTFNFLNSLNDKEKVVSFLRPSTNITNNQQNYEDKEILLNERNDLLDTVLAPEHLRPISFAYKRNSDFLTYDYSEKEEVNGHFSSNISSQQKLPDKQLQAIEVLNGIRNRKKFKLSYEKQDFEKEANNKVDEILEELDDMKIPDLPITEDVEIDLNWLGDANEF